MNELVVFDPVKAELAEYKKMNASLEFDYEDPQGNKDARSHIYKLRQAKTKIADIHKVAKAQALGICRLLDGEKKKLTAEVEEMIDVHYKPVKEIEERVVKAAAEKANAERLEAIRIEAERTAEREKREEELATREAAAKAKEEEIAYMQRELDAAKQAEIDKQAAVKTAQEAAERDKVEAAAKVVQDKKDAEEKARQEVQRVKDEATKIAADLVAEEVRIKAEALAEQEREAKIEAKRIADTAHRENVESEIFDELTTLLDDSQKAADVLEHLKAGYVPHVTINY